MLESNDSVSSLDGLKIKVIGIGGAGTNAVGALKLDVGSQVQCAAINTDAQALNASPLTDKLLIGKTLTRGLGAGGEIEIGRAAAEQDREAIGEFVADTDLIILVAGLGGGTGSVATTVVAEVASATGALVLAFVTLPFSFEGQRRKLIAEDSIGDLRSLVHGLISLPNDILLQESDEEATVLNAFAIADRWIGRGINSLCTMLLKTGLINQDFGSLRAVFQGRGGKTVFGTGVATGANYVDQALEDLFMCPLIHLGDRPAQLDRILVNLIAGTDLGIAKIHEIITEISQRFDSREDIVFGAVIEPELTESLEICVLGKSEIEPSRGIQSKDSLAFDSKATALHELDLESSIVSSDTKSRAVHTSKLSKKRAQQSNQDEFNFIEMEAQRGYFEKTDRNVYNEEDLDVPTYLRRGIKIKIK